MIYTAAIAFPSNATAGAWPIMNTVMFTELSSKYYWADKHYHNDGYYQDGDKYNEFRHELKLQYGLSEDITLLLSVPYKQAESKHSSDTYKKNGFEDISFGLKHRIFVEERSTSADPCSTEPCPSKIKTPELSAQVKLKVPAGYNYKDSPSLGADKIELEGRLLIGKRFQIDKVNPPPGVYSVSAEVGYTFRESGLPGRIPYFAEFNLRAYREFYVRAILDGIFVTSSTSVEPTQTQILDKEFEEYSKAMILFRLGSFETEKKSKKEKMKHLSSFIKEFCSIELGYGYTFHGKNTAQGSEVVLNLAVNY